MKDILIVPNPLLRQKSLKIEEINKKELDLSKKMINIMKKANGIGLAANQIGILQQIITVHIKDDEKKFTLYLILKL